MKKKLGIVVTALTLVTVLLMSLCGCSTFGKIKSAFEKKEYKESENIQTYQSEIMKYLNADSEEELEQICNIHLLYNGMKVAIICEFSSTKEMNEQIESSETLKGVIKDAQNSDYVNGNCILLPIAVPEVVEIFKNA